MKLCLKLTAMLLIVSALSCTVIIGLARTHPPSNPLTPIGISLCDEDLCIQTIRPGKTSWASATSILQIHSDATTFQDVFNIDGHTIARSFWPGRDNMTLVELQSSVFRGKLMSAGDLIAYFGVPSKTQLLYGGSQPLLLLYPQFLVEIETNDRNPLAPASPVTAISLPGPFRGSFAETSMNERWCGFTKLSDYRDRCVERKMPE
jgi:hypothetical protein